MRWRARATVASLSWARREWQREHIDEEHVFKHEQGGNTRDHGALKAIKAFDSGKRGSTCKEPAPRHQPLAVLYILPPAEALQIFLFTSPVLGVLGARGPKTQRAQLRRLDKGGNQWTISAPRNLWLTMPGPQDQAKSSDTSKRFQRFYLLGAWLFELLVRPLW